MTTGSETQILAKLGGQEIVGVFRVRMAAWPGEMVSVAPDPSAAHLFDDVTGRRLN